MEQAAGYLRDTEEWFSLLREVYKERLAREFQGGSPNQSEIEKTGAKLAVMSELQNELQKLIDGKLIEEAEGEKLC